MVANNIAEIDPRARELYESIMKLRSMSPDMTTQVYSLTLKNIMDQYPDDVLDLVSDFFMYLARQDTASRNGR